MVRHVSVGEGGYSGTESLIRQLLTAAHPRPTLPTATAGPEHARRPRPDQTPETYLGSARARHLRRDSSGSGTQPFQFPASLPANEWALVRHLDRGSGQSLTSGQNAVIELNYTAADVYLDVGGTGTITATVNGKTTHRTRSPARPTSTPWSAGRRRAAARSR